MFPFGQLMLPVIGVVAIGLLVIGVKLFFFAGPESPVIVAIPEASHETPAQVVDRSAQESSTRTEPSSAPPKKASTTDRTSSQPAATEQVLAVPVTDSPEAAPVESTSTASSGQGEKRRAGTKGSTATSAHPLEGNWAVQIGAFSVKSSAETLLTKAQAQGFNGKISQARIDGKTFYRVQIPSGNTRETALALSERLKGNGYPTLIVNLTP